MVTCATIKKLKGRCANTKVWIWRSSSKTRAERYRKEFNVYRIEGSFRREIRPEV